MTTITSSKSYYVRCPACKGKKRVWACVGTPNTDYRRNKRCPSCYGQGGYRQGATWTIGTIGWVTAAADTFAATIATSKDNDDNS